MYFVRVIAAKLPKEKAEQARKRKQRKVSSISSNIFAELQPVMINLHRLSWRSLILQLFLFCLNSINNLCFQTSPSQVFKRKLIEQEMEQSMSRVGHGIDNGPTEGFWGIIKAEMYQMYEITDEASLRHAINDYIRFYSTERPQDRYHCKTPSEVRNEALQSEIIQEYPIPVNKRIEKFK